MQEYRRPPHAPLRPRFAFQHQLQPQMAKRASIPLLLLAALIGSAAAAPRAPLALHFAAALLCGGVRALVARPSDIRRPVTRLRSTIDDTDIDVDARILQAKQDLLERVYAGEAGVPVGEPPVLVNADPCDEEAILDEGERRLQAGGKNGGGGDGESCDTHLIFKWSMFGISTPKSGRT